MDGWLKIGTQLDSSQIEKDIKNLTKSLNALEKEEEKLNNKKIKLEVDTSEYKAKVDELSNYTNKELEKSTTEIQIQTVLDIETAELNKIKGEYQSQFTAISEINTNLAKNKALQNSIGAEISQNNSKLKTTNSDTSGIFANASTGINATIKKVAKLSLSVLGIRTAYNFVRSAANKLATYNKQISDDLEYLTYSVATSLESVITKIVSLIYTALQYVNYLAMAWFGVNIFANATTSALNESANAADELNNSLAGFDDLEVIGDTSDTASSDAISPSVDLSDMETFVAPDWLETLGENFENIKNLAIGIGAALVLWKIANFLNDIIFLSGTMLPLWIIVAGLGLVIYSVIELMNDPTWENFALLLTGIGIILAGVALLFLSLPIAIAAAVVLAIASIIYFWDEIVAFAENYTGEFLLIIAALIAGILLLIVGFVPAMIALIVGLIIYLIYYIYDSWDSIVQFLQDGWEKLKEVFWNAILAIKDFFVGLWDSFKNGASDAWDGVKSIFSTVADFFKDIFSNAWDGVKSVFSTGGEIFSGITDGILDSFKSIVNALIDGINTVVAIPFNGINIALTKLKSVEVLGVSPFGWLSTISIPKIPKLATGGIIDVPGSGVTATIGEAGKEAVLPLENNTGWMDILADKISNNSSMELTINVIYEDGKKIIKKINSTNTKAGKQLLKI